MGTGEDCLVRLAWPGLVWSGARARARKNCTRYGEYVSGLAFLQKHVHLAVKGQANRSGGGGETTTTSHLSVRSILSSSGESLLGDSENAQRNTGDLVLGFSSALYRRVVAYWNERGYGVWSTESTEYRIITTYSVLVPLLRTRRY